MQPKTEDRQTHKHVEDGALHIRRNLLREGEALRRQLPTDWMLRVIYHGNCVEKFAG